MMTTPFLLEAGNDIKSAFSYISEYLKSTKAFINILDMLLLSGLVFLVWFLFRKSRITNYVALFVAGWALLTFAASALHLTAFAYTMRYIMRCASIGGIFILEMKILDQLGKSGDFSLLQWFKQLFSKEKPEERIGAPIDAICQAALDLSRNKTGGLIVIERKNKLDDLIHTGVDIDAVVSPYLIRNIFYEGAPLHDGALIIRNGRIFAAGCILPITHRLDVNPDLGTRHRAAIGMSESTDAVIIVISEETGIISIACNGEFTRDYNHRTLKNELLRLLNDGKEDDDEAEG